MSPVDPDPIAATRRWLECAVIGLNLCPFAKSVHVGGRVRFCVSDATDVDALLADLRAELALLKESDPTAVETTLLIHPRVLHDFLDYNDFLGCADSEIARLNLDGEFQIASFHPHYRFAATDPEDVTNCTNRSPYPMLHLLRQSSVERAVAAFPDAEKIYGANMETMRRLGHDGWSRLLRDGD